MARIQQVKTWEFPLQDPSNYYVVELDGGKRILVDAGAKPLPQNIAGSVEGVILTHWHWDHTYGITSLKSRIICASKSTLEKLRPNRVRESVYRVVYAMGLTPENDASLMFLETMISRYRSISTTLAENDTYPIENCPLLEGVNVIECPGHTDDHICPVIHRTLFAGDTLVPGESPTIIDYHSFLDSTIKILGNEEWANLAPGHGPITGRREAVEYVRKIVKRKNRKIYKLLAILRGEWTSFNTLLRALYGLDASLTAYVAARTLIGYLVAAEKAGLVEVDRDSRPWRVRARI